MIKNIKCVQFIKLEGDIDKILHDEKFIGEALKVMHIKDSETNDYYVAIAVVDNFPEDIHAQVVSDIDKMDELNDVLINNL